MGKELIKDIRNFWKLLHKNQPELDPLLVLSTAVMMKMKQVLKEDYMTGLDREVAAAEVIREGLKLAYKEALVDLDRECGWTL